jgi:hypothetical protein
VIEVTILAVMVVGCLFIGLLITAPPIIRHYFREKRNSTLAMLREKEKEDE